MNTVKTKRLVERNGVIAIRADRTDESPDVDQLLIELGNSARSIPYVAIYPANGAEPILLDGIITQSQILRELEKAGPSPAGGQLAHAD